MSGKTNENNFIGILILIFFMIGVPSFLIKEVTKGESEPAAVSKVVPAKANQKNSFAESQTDGETFAFTAPVVDEAKVFSESARGKLNEFLVNLNYTKGIQIGVLIVNDMGGESIESFSLRHAEKRALGQKGIDNGALLVVAMKEHGVRIETGYGTEGVLTDAKCARILRNVLVPAFKSGNYEEGITKAVEYMAAIISEDESTVTSAGVKSEKNESKGSVPYGAAAVEFSLCLLSAVLVMTTGVEVVEAFPAEAVFPEAEAALVAVVHRLHGKLFLSVQLKKNLMINNKSPLKCS